MSLIKVELLKFKVMPEFELDGKSIQQITEHFRCDILFCAIVGGSSAAQTSLIGHNLCKTEKSTTSITRFAKTRRISKHFPRI